MTAEKRTTLYLVMSYLGTAAIALFLAATVLDWPDFVRGLSIGMLLVSLWMLMRRKLRDEYIQSLWNAGTSLAFATLVAIFLFAPALEGFFDGATGRADIMDTPASLAPAVAILGFFVGFHFKRWKGA